MTGKSGMVYIVDDDVAVRESLELMLNSAEIECQAYPSAQDFLTAYDDQWQGCILLDIDMPGMDGMALQEALNERQNIMPIIFVTGHGDVPMAVEAMRQGAIDFLQKPYSDEQLIAKVREALVLDEEQRAELAQKQLLEARIKTLTPRERQVMDMMLDGCANKVIAIDLGISQRTVEIHRARVMEKMQARALAHLVKMGIAAGVVLP